MKNHSKRRDRERKEVRLRVLDAARELFVNGGEEALTLRKVAQRIEYSATTIYLYFPNKESLVRELCAAEFAAFSRVLVVADRIPDPMERLRKVMTIYVDFGLQYPGHYRAMFMALGGASPTPSAQKTLESAPRPPAAENEEISQEPPGPYDFLHSAVFKAMAAGCFKPEYRDVALLSQTLWCGLHGIVSLYLVRARHPAIVWKPVHSTLEMMIECLLNGMTNAASASSPSWRK